MRSTGPSTDRRRQRGQAIVLITLCLTVLFGLLGLAVDGGRAYVDRRELQDAVDAAALAAGDDYSNYGDTVSALNRGARLWALNSRLDPTTVSLAIAGSVGGTTSGSWSDATHSITIKGTGNAFGGTTFTAQSQHSIGLALMQVLGFGPSISVGADAKALIGNQSQTPALLTLGQGTCDGTSTPSLTIQGNANVAIVGDVYSNGSFKVQSTGANITVAGNVYDNCTAPVPSQVQYYCYPSGSPPTAGACPAGQTLGSGYPGAPVLPDPRYTSSNSAYQASQPNPGASALLNPGVYAQDPAFNSAACYFLTPGVYTWQAGYSSQGGLVSNELKPPDEPRWDPVAGALDYTQRSSIQFWQGLSTSAPHCDGSFDVTAYDDLVPGHNLGGASWGVVVTATRTDAYGGTSYSRESAPSMCRPVTATKGFTVAVSNVPGAQGYNVYASTAGCTGPFGYIGQIANPVSELSGGGCPSLPAKTGSPAAYPPTTSGTTGGCSMGYVTSPIYNNLNVSVQPTPAAVGSAGPCKLDAATGATYQYVAPCGIGTGAAGSAFPPGDGGERKPDASTTPNEPPARGISVNGGGDRAVQNQCRPMSTSASSPCAGATVTPGAVQFYLPGNQCLKQTGNGATYIYSGFQFKWISLFSLGSCPTAGGSSINGTAFTSFIGTIYLPNSSLSIAGSDKAPIAGQVIVHDAVLDGTAGINISYNPDVAPPPPAAKLIY